MRRLAPSSSLPRVAAAVQGDRTDRGGIYGSGWGCRRCKGEGAAMPWDLVLQVGVEAAARAFYCHPRAMAPCLIIATVCRSANYSQAQRVVLDRQSAPVAPAGGP